MNEKGARHLYGADILNEILSDKRARFKPQKNHANARDRAQLQNGTI